MSEPRTKAGRAFIAWDNDAVEDSEIERIIGKHHWTTADAVAAIENEAALLSSEPASTGLDVERLYQAIVDELVVLWGEPSDAISAQVRPIVARNIADRYARLSVSSPQDDPA